MKPLKLTMSAFGSYARAQAVDFREADHGLFLITGDTGSGKTTIFDGISFALFGELSGGLRDGSMMRSQYAGEEETYVELMFSDRGQIYTVRRSPAYQRLSKRKNKDGERSPATVSAKVSLVMPDGREAPGRIGEINEKIREIVGVDRNQFAQIAMIAQGEYIKLLHASSKERKEIFARIFDTGIYGRIQQKLKEKNTALSERLADNRKLCEHEAGQVTLPESAASGEPAVFADSAVPGEPAASGESAASGEPLPPADLNQRWPWALERLETRPEELLETLSQITKESGRQAEASGKRLEEVLRAISEQNIRILQAGEKNKRLDGLEASRLKLINLEAEEEGWQKRRENSRRAELAARVRAAEEPYIEAVRKLQEAKERTLLLQNELDGLKTPLLKAEALWRETEKQLALKRPQLTADIAKISELLPSYQTYEACRAEMETSLRLLERLSKEQKKTETAAALRQTSREKLERQQADLECSAALLSESTVRLGQMGERMESLARLKAGLDTLKNCYKEREKERAEVERRQAGYEQAASGYEEKNRRFIQVQAGILASGLSDGVPCPVCGSLNHPKKAELTPKEVTKEQVDLAGRMREQADQLMRKALGAYQEKNAEYAALGNQVKAEYERLTGKTGETYTQLWQDTQSLEAQSRMAYESEEHQNKTFREQERVWKENRRNLQRLMQEEEEQRRLLGEGQEAVTEARLVLQEAELRAEALRKNLSWETKDEAMKEQNRLKDCLSLLERKAEAAAQNQATLQESVTKKSGYLASEKENAAALDKEKTALYQVWMDRLKQQNFSDERDYRLAFLPEEERQNLKEAISQYDDDRLKAKAAYEQYRELTEGDQREPEEELRSELIRLSKEKERLTAESSRLLAARARNDGAYENLKRLLKEREALREKKQLVETLYTTADGKVSGAARIDFQTYMQRRYFKQMVAAANKRLYPMTGGQFLLQCRDLEILGRQGEVGLNLDIYSPASDRIRDVKTLSGGESFLAALSLALGMADVIQNTAGRVNIEAMFIDEGFGSLDEESRLKAVRVLKELAEGSRLVGIISHVTELKEQLDRKLLVKKSETGSSVRWSLDS